VEQSFLYVLSRHNMTDYNKLLLKLIVSIPKEFDTIHDIES